MSLPPDDSATASATRMIKRYLFGEWKTALCIPRARLVPLWCPGVRSSPSQPPRHGFPCAFLVSCLKVPYKIQVRPLDSRPVAKPLESGKWASTADVAAAARVTTVTALDWAKRGVLPAYTVVYAGRRGRAARWPLHAPAQAVWVRERLDASHLARTGLIKTSSNASAASSVSTKWR